MDSLKKIKELNDLRKRGILTDEEFETEKKKLLSFNEFTDKKPNGLSSSELNKDSSLIPNEQKGLLTKIADFLDPEGGKVKILEKDRNLDLLDESALRSLKFNSLEIINLNSNIIFNGSYFFAQGVILPINTLISAILIDSLEKSLVNFPLSDLNSYFKDNFQGGFSFRNNGGRIDLIVKMADLTANSRFNMIALIGKFNYEKNFNSFDESNLNERDKIYIQELKNLLLSKIITQKEFELRSNDIFKKYF